MGNTEIIDEEQAIAEFKRDRTALFGKYYTKEAEKAGEDSELVWSKADEQAARNLIKNRDNYWEDKLNKGYDNHSKEDCECEYCKRTRKKTAQAIFADIRKKVSEHSDVVTNMHMMHENDIIELEKKWKASGK